MAMTVEQLPIPPEPAAPIAVEWWIAPLATGSHAFYRRPGFPRSVCRAERWTGQWERATDDVTRCVDCTAGVDHNGATESELRLLDGNR